MNRFTLRDILSSAVSFSINVTKNDCLLYKHPNRFYDGDRSYNRNIKDVSNLYTITINDCILYNHNSSIRDSSEVYWRTFKRYSYKAAGLNLDKIITAKADNNI